MKGTKGAPGLLSLADPNADRIVFWDESTNGFGFLASSSGLQISTTNISTINLADQRVASTALAYNGNSSTFTAHSTSGLLHYVSSSLVGSLNTAGDFAVKGDIIAFGGASVSDERLKENIEVVDNAVEKLQSLDGVTFNYTNGGKDSAGVIAQSLEKVLPSAVTTRAGDDIVNATEYKTVDYAQLSALFIEAIKELKEENQELRKMIEELGNK